ncbi:MAG: zinc-dependent metalloprotease family protein, partial [Verrucomicrobiota bacterium]
DLGAGLEEARLSEFLSDVISDDEDTNSVTLDLLCVYTPAARLSEGSLPNMLANIAQSVSLANQVHANSKTLIQFNLAHSAEVNYTESRTNAANDLAALRNVDGAIDEVHTLREIYEADFVCMFLKTNLTGGQAYRPITYDAADQAFSIVRVQQSDTTSYTTVHEISHNMGIGHSKTQRSRAGNEAFYTYSAGWQWEDATSSASIGYCSIMTYENFDSNSNSGDSSGREYDRVAHLSNPDISYNENATGDPVHADAARTIREGRFFYSGFSGINARPTFTDFPHVYDFESFENGWAQSSTASHKWKTDQSGPTPSDGTGPSSANSGNNYAYVEASQKNGLTSILEAEFDFSFLNQPQASFFYHMRDVSVTGQIMGDLYFEVSTDAGANWATLFARSDNQGPRWQSAEIDLSAYAGLSVLLRFRAVVGGSFLSDIAIDDIQILDAGPANFTEWITAVYPEIHDASANGDPDGDGLNSFLEYALGRSPDFAESDRLPEPFYDPVARTLTYRFTRGRANVRYVLESVNQMDAWNTATSEWDSRTATNLVGIGETQSVTIDALDVKKFVRLNVTEE